MSVRTHTLISGARSTGKTSLLTRIAEEAQVHGWICTTTTALEIREALHKTVASPACSIDDKALDRAATSDN